MRNLPEGSSSTTPSNHERRVTAIRDEFARQKTRGVKSQFIIIDLAYRFYLTESTIAAIVWKRGRYGASVSQSTSNLAVA